MPDQSETRMLVRIVADALLRKEPEATVVAKLVSTGVAASDAPSLFRAIKAACQQGVQSVITGGLSAPEGPPRDPLLAEAFRVGQASIRGAACGVWFRRVLVVLLVAITVTIAIWLVLRYAW
jgi:hypothetical protein